MKKRLVDWKVLIVCLIIVYSVAFIGSIFTSADTEWYQSIKPAITPPNLVFPIVWNILFFLIALSLYFSWIKANKKQKSKIAVVFLINFFLNILWSILFFTMRNSLLSFYELVFLLWPSIWAMIFAVNHIDKKSVYLLIPYLLWVGFAGILNYLIAF